MTATIAHQERVAFVGELGKGKLPETVSHDAHATLSAWAARLIDELVARPLESVR
jgi:hypothetical protein